MSTILLGLGLYITMVFILSSFFKGEKKLGDMTDVWEKLKNDRLN